MGQGIRPSIYTLPFGSDLCDATVDLVIRQCGSDPLQLSKAIIFLPNNRAIRAMNEAFVRNAKPGLLMPRLVAIGDLAIDEALAPMLDPVRNDTEIPGLIAPLKRQLLLAGMLRSEYAKHERSIDATEALRLARLLATLIDELDIEQINIRRFDEIANDKDFAADPDLAGHWQSSYAILLKILPVYQDYMRKAGLAGPAAIRNILLERLAQRLKTFDADIPIFASGISTAAPAIANLLRHIATLANGHVILPPIDILMDDEDWEQLGAAPSHNAVPDEQSKPIFAQETHPQYHLKLLLERMAINRSEVSLLQHANHSTEQADADKGADKGSIIPNIFCPPKATAQWVDLPKQAKKMPTVRLAVAQDSAEEARSIAILVRQALEDKDKRIAIATPDRELAIRISEQLKRWDIHVDDTAGQPLFQSPAGSLWMALLSGFSNQFTAVSILAILKHPLAHAGEDRLSWLSMARQLDMELRGPSSGLGLHAITKRLSDNIKEPRNARRIEELNKLLDWWKPVAEEFKALDDSFQQGFSAWLESMIAIAGKLSGDAIWKKAEGRQLSTFLEDIGQYDFSDAGKLDRDILPSFFAELASGQVVRPSYGGHPRVAIFGLLEARLQKAEILICAGLNEGSWPQLPSPDPWLAPRIRRQLGLPSLERNIGLSAHDLASALGAKECIITRAKRDRGGPTVASRFLLRIQAFLGDALRIEDNAIALARILDKPENYIDCPEPKIQPSAQQRKIGLSITDFDRLLSDPYAIYAKRILRISPLDDVDAGPDHAWRGTFVHDILEKWAKQDDGDPDKLMQRVDAALSDASLHPSLRILWQPRILQGLRWVAEESAELRKQGSELWLAEAEGSIQLSGVDIRGKVDRIDQDADGQLTIIDYKTGQPPKNKQIEAGYALQLGLLGHMATQGAFDKNTSGISAANEIQHNVGALKYWSLAKKSGNSEGSFGYPTKLGEKRGKQEKPTEDIITDMIGKAEGAIADYINGNTPFVAKLHPEYINYADYDQLSRLQEWDGRQSPLHDDGHIDDVDVESGDKA